MKLPVHFVRVHNYVPRSNQVLLAHVCWPQAEQSHLQCRLQYLSDYGKNKANKLAEGAKYRQRATKRHQQ